MTRTDFYFERYRVSILDEGDCPECGEPVLEGETAFEVWLEGQESPTEAGYCSAACTDRAIASLVEAALMDEEDARFDWEGVTP